MRNTIKTLSLGLGLLLATSSAHAGGWGQYHELGTTYQRKAEKNNLTGYLFNNLNYKASDRVSLSVDFATDLSYITAGSGNFDQDHSMLRVNMVTKDLEILNGWQSESRLRWYIPTGELQQQGGFGIAEYRIGFTRDFGKVGFYWKPSIVVGLVDSGYQKYTVAGATPEGNTLIGWKVEFSPSYTIAKGFDFSWYNSVSQYYTGGAPGQDGAMGKVSWYFEPEITFPLVAWLNTSLSVNSSTKLNSTFDIDFGALKYTLKIGKAF